MKNIASHFPKLSLRKLGVKQYLIIAGAVLVLGAGAFVYTKQSGGNRAMGAELASIEGSVEYRSADDKPWQSAAVDLPITLGMSVRVSGEGRAVVNLDDGSAVRLNSNSTVQFANLTYKHVLIENDGGQVYTRVTKSDSRIFEVKTSKSTYRSMGTAYRTIDTPEKEGVEVYHSKVNILGVTDNSVIVEQGSRYYQIDQANPDLTNKVTEIDKNAIAADSFIAWNSEEDRKEFESELGVLFDLKPPALEVSSPASGLTTNADKIDIKGTTETGAKVLINGESVTNTDGAFAKQVSLNVGANAFKVEAEDGAGNKTVKTITVTRNAAASPTPPPTSANSFKLYGTKVDGGISFSWSISGYDTSKGFKLMLSTSPNPTYEGKGDKVYIEGSSTRAYTWKIKDGQTYNFRICTYNGSGCSVYSNNISVTAPTKPVTVSPSPTGSVTLSAGSGSAVSWVLSGSAPNGYKLVWNNTGSPVYPGNSATYYEPSATNGSITNTPGTYYVRLCMYKDGTCPIYSNQVTVTIP
jgi:hypothetical protein